MDINYRVIAFDPGGTTGWATYSAMHVPGINRPWRDVKWDCGQLGPEKHHAALEQLLGMQRVQQYVVVCERFNDRPGGTFSVDLSAREYIGVIEKYCQEDEVDLVMQMPAQGKGFVKNVNLKRLGLWEGTEWKHAMDARRHLLWYLIHGQPKRFDLLDAGWPNA